MSALLGLGGDENIFAATVEDAEVASSAFEANAGDQEAVQLEVPLLVGTPEGEGLGGVAVSFTHHGDLEEADALR